jgi:cytochrome c
MAKAHIEVQEITSICRIPFAKKLLHICLDTNFAYKRASHALIEENMNYRLMLGAIALASAAGVPCSTFAADEAAIGKNLATNHCASCHTFGKGEPAGQGPNLFGIIGRKAGTAQGYAYSEGFKKALADKSWDHKTLDRWLTDTQSVAPGSGMVYFQDDAGKRLKIIRYLESLK